MKNKKINRSMLGLYSNIISNPSISESFKHRKLLGIYEHMMIEETNIDQYDISLLRDKAQIELNQKSDLLIDQLASEINVKDCSMDKPNREFDVNTFFAFLPAMKNVKTVEEIDLVDVKTVTGEMGRREEKEELRASVNEFRKEGIDRRVERENMMEVDDIEEEKDSVDTSNIFSANSKRSRNLHNVNTYNRYKKERQTRLNRRLKTINYGKKNEDDDDLDMDDQDEEIPQNQRVGTTESQNTFVSAVDELNTQYAAKGLKPPIKKRKADALGDDANNNNRPKKRPRTDNGDDKSDDSDDSDDPELNDPAYKNLPKNLVKRIISEVLDMKTSIEWDDIAGLEKVKDTLYEMVILPALRPELFTGLRQPAKGLLLFGPPGNGKTMIAKAVAAQANMTFFSISASSLTSKYIGEGEKLMRALFTVATVKQPSFIFIDELDSLLTVRGESDHEASRRLKTEFLCQFDGATGNKDDRVVVMGATNRPQDLDEAARRRFSKRIYVYLPDMATRIELLKITLSKAKHCLSDQDQEELAELTNGYSGYDISIMCSEAALGPIRELVKAKRFSTVNETEVRPLNLDDFKFAMKNMNPSVSPDECMAYELWNQEFGTSSF